MRKAGNAPGSAVPQFLPAEATLPWVYFSSPLSLSCLCFFSLLVSFFLSQIIRILMFSPFCFLFYLFSRALTLLGKNWSWHARNVSWHVFTSRTAQVGADLFSGTVFPGRWYVCAERHRLPPNSQRILPGFLNGYWEFKNGCEQYPMLYIYVHTHIFFI